MQALSILALVFLFSFVRHAHSQCDVPPESWCNNAVIAQKCGVYEQCKKALLRTTTDDAPLVQFALYYESLCPYCMQFITTTLFPAFPKLQSIMNVTMVPYGWATEQKEGEKYVFQCQHGPDECKGNLIETCAINLLKNVSVYLPYIDCIENTLDPVKAATTCGKAQGVDVDKILACSTSAVGSVMEHQMGEMFRALKPKPKGVPWMSVNGDHSMRIQNRASDNFIKLICHSYKGQQKPPACSNM